MKNKILVVKVGNENDPATESDIRDVCDELHRARDEGRPFVASHPVQFERISRNVKTVHVIPVVPKRWEQDRSKLQRSKDILIVRVGSEDRPACRGDVEDMSDCIRNSYKTGEALVTHHVVSFN